MSEALFDASNTKGTLNHRYKYQAYCYLRAIHMAIIYAKIHKASNHSGIQIVTNYEGGKRWNTCFRGDKLIPSNPMYEYQLRKKRHSLGDIT